MFVKKKTKVRKIRNVRCGIKELFIGPLVIIRNRSTSNPYEIGIANLTIAGNIRFPKNVIHLKQETKNYHLTT